jgi:hypothetical protein
MLFLLSSIIIPILYLWYSYPKCIEDSEYYNGGKQILHLRNPFNPFESGYPIEVTNRTDFSITKYMAFIFGVLQSGFVWRFFFYLFSLDDQERHYYNRMASTK